MQTGYCVRTNQKLTSRRGVRIDFVAASPPSVVASEQQLLVHPLDDLHQPPNDRPADRIARVRLSWGYTTPNRSALSLRSVAISRSNLLISAWLECGIVDGRRDLVHHHRILLGRNKVLG